MDKELESNLTNNLSGTAKILTNVGSGSGFLFKGGFVVTNYHVIVGATKILVKFSEYVKIDVEKIVATNATIDFAILKIKMDAHIGVNPLKLGNSDKLTIGDKIFSLGNPTGETSLEKTVTEGIISAFRPEKNQIQMSTRITHGSSGGPVINERGEVIGIAQGGIPDVTSVNYFIPINLLKPYLKKYEIKWETIFFNHIAKSQIESITSNKLNRLYILSKNSIRILNYDGIEVDDHIKINNTIYIFSSLTEEYGELLGLYLKTGELNFIDPTTCIRKAFRFSLPDNISCIAISRLQNINNLHIERILCGIENKLYYFNFISFFGFLTKKEKPIKKINNPENFRELESFKEIKLNYKVNKIIDCSEPGGSGDLLYILLLNNDEINIVRFYEDNQNRQIYSDFMLKFKFNVSAASLSPDRNILLISDKMGKLKYCQITDLLKDKLNFKSINLENTYFGNITSIIFDQPHQKVILGTSIGSIICLNYTKVFKEELSD